MNFTVPRLLQDYLLSHMDAEEEVWFWLRIFFHFETAMLEFIHHWAMPYTEKQQAMFEAEHNPPPLPC